MRAVVAIAPIKSQRPSIASHSIYSSHITHTAYSYINHYNMSDIPQLVREHLFHLTWYMAKTHKCRPAPVKDLSAPISACRVPRANMPLHILSQ